MFHSRKENTKAWISGIVNGRYPAAELYLQGTKLLSYLVYYCLLVALAVNMCRGTLLKGVRFYLESTFYGEE